MLVNICPMGNMKTLDNMTAIYHLHSPLRVLAILEFLRKVQ